MKTFLIRGLIVLSIVVNIPQTSWAWHDQTHIAIAQAAGYRHAYNAAGADITKIKAGEIEAENHYYNNNQNAVVTEKRVFDQVDRYNHPGDEEGHLYGAIIASLREFKSTTLAGKYAEYHMAFAVHYLGDLSQPFHNIAYDDFNKAHHLKNDGVVEEEVSDRIGAIQKKMYDIRLRPDHFEEDLAKEIARIANLSHTLGLKLRSENRDMTKEEAYTQLGHSASLLKGILKTLGENQ